MRKQVTPPQVAVIGCGYWGRNLARNFHALGALAGVHDHNDERAETVAREFDARVLNRSAVFSEASISAVIVATQAETHFAVAREALVAGKHVLVEKPLAASLSEAEALCALADTAGRTLMVGHQLRFHPAFTRLEEMVRSGDLGDLRYICSNRLDVSNTRGERNILWSLAPHDVSMILALLGELPESVSAIGGCCRQPGVLDVAAAGLAFPDGRLANISVSWVHPFEEHKLTVVGDRATAVFDDDREWVAKLLRYRRHDDEPSAGPDYAVDAATPVPLEPAEPLTLECRHFLECIETGRDPRTGGAESRRVLGVIEAVERSIEERSAVGPETAARATTMRRTRP